MTLHNTALFDVDSDPNAALKKLNFLLQNPPFPPETFRNLLLLYCRHQYYAMAADVMAENAHLTYTVRSSPFLSAWRRPRSSSPPRALTSARGSWTACLSTWTP